MKIDEIDENSEQIREILEKPPSQILNWGITIIFVIVVTMFFVAWLIKYPTVVNSQITITTKIPPHKIIAKTSGNLFQLFVKENELVQPNQMIGVIKNTANYRDIMILKELVYEQNIFLEDNSIALFNFQGDFELGDVQSYYLNFKKAYIEYKEFLSLHNENKQLPILKKQTKITLKSLKNQLRKTNLFIKELELLRKDYKRDEYLFEKGIISERVLEEKKRDLLIAERNYKNLRENETNANLDISNLEKEINLHKITNTETKNRLKVRVEESYEKLRVSLLDWEERFMLTSPIEGRVSFFNFWAKNQHVNSGDEVLTIVPKGDNKIIGKMLMPIQNSGQVAQDQKVIIHLTGYPYQENGALIGKVKNISLYPRQNTYAVEVELPSPLKTTFKRQIEFKSELSGVANVVTEDLRLIERIFYQIRAVFNQ